jgi:mono/diheme cytochrome c family protein
MAFMKPGVYQPHPERDAQWNRGAYLVQAGGHCGSCHTPRGIGFQESGYDESADKFLAGTANDHWFAANLSADTGSGLGRLNEAQIASFLKTGHANGLMAFGNMVAQVENSTQYLSDDDLRAIAHYLKSLSARQPSGRYTPYREPTATGVSVRRIDDDQIVGAAVYKSFCAQCHQADGAGVAQVYPRLAGNPAVLSDDTTSLIRLMVEGGSSANTQWGPPRQAMPAFAGRLSDLQIAKALSYLRASWGNDARPVTTNDVTQLRGQIHK